ncbi:MAG: 30S ribosomal protein S4 [Candidatus Marinimicrobia bacterium]|nr:30S ribosomal protein S4 [Candidatus Neomarinimicrobiota bacterium]MCF7827498.1 30S ribosomal protein S4 [Candidatus Neomarinimicrobiota bacterium]MCF7882372.1 30S ribosomal protein S4 [Candidatus Neomarinimicrobiota bacterium]
MARYTGPVCKLCRREGEKLFLKGNRCLSSKCAIERKGYAPGQHGQGRRRRLSDYGIQLREKQKMRRIYGILEKQFRNYFKKADGMAGVTGTNLIQILESRLDNTVYRLGFAPSRAAARMLVKHRHIQVNGRTVDIPSFSVSQGDKIQVRERSKKMESIHESMQKIKGEHPLPWLELDKAKMEGTFMQVPERDEVGLEVNEQLVVELYSK